MAKYYFDAKNAYVTADGALVKSGFEKEGAFALGMFSEGHEDREKPKFSFRPSAA